MINFYAETGDQICAEKMLTQLATFIQAAGKFCTSFVHQVDAKSPVFREETPVLFYVHICTEKYRAMSNQQQLPLRTLSTGSGDFPILTAQVY